MFVGTPVALIASVGAVRNAADRGLAGVALVISILEAVVLVALLGAIMFSGG